MTIALSRQRHHPGNKQSMPRSSANLLLLVAGLVWGLGFVAQETAMEDIGPFTFMTLRFALATLALLPFAIMEHRKTRAQADPSRQITGKNRLAMFTVGLMFFLAMALQQIGLLGTTVTNAGVLTGLYVILTPLIAFCALRQSQPRLVWPAAIMAFVGIWMLGGGGLDRLSWGDWFVILGAVFAALHVLAMGHAVTGAQRPAAVATGQFLISSLFSAVCYIIARAVDWQFEPPVSVQTLLAAAPEILYAALFAGALAFFLMAICQQYTRAADAAILMSSEALFAAAAGALLLGDRLSWIGYCGGALLFAAILVTGAASAKFEESTV
jgi:drug/metabolite transporter (DMT)-like permease